MPSLGRQALRNIRAIVAAALLCAVAGASGQGIYREVAPTGHVTYTDRPGAEPTGRKDRAHATNVATALANNAAISSRLATSVNAKEAVRSLQQAQTQRRHGAQPLPGELLQGAGELFSRYWRRQERLRIAVEQAQRRVNETRQPPLAQR